MDKKLKISLILISLLFTITTIKVLAYNEPVVHDTLPKTQTDFLLQSNYFTHPMDLSYTQPNVNLEGYDEILENDDLKVFYDKESLALRILNKKTQYIWMSDLDHVYEERLNNDWVNMVRSAISFSYLNSKDNVKYDNLIESRRDISIKKTIAGNTARFDLDFTYTKIRLSLVITLDGASLDIKIPKDSIEEYGDNKLYRIELYPFLGATKFDEVPGYTFIPDGSGALVRYQRNNIMKSSFITRFFGKDAYINTLTNDVLPLNLPVYGMVHGDKNALFTEVKSGAQFGEFTMQFAGNTTDFNFNYVDFILREKYSQKTIDEQSISKTTENRYIYDIELKHTFLSNDEANYVGMAHTYQKELFNNIEEKSHEQENIPLHLDVIAGNSYQSLLFDKFVEMTSLERLKEIDDELTTDGLDNILYTYRGYNKGGLSKMNLFNYEFDRRLKDEDVLKQFDNFYLYYQPALVYNQAADKKELLQKITKSYVLSDYYYYNKDASVLKGISNALDYAKENQADIALDGITNLLYSDKNMTRVEMINALNEKLGNKIPMYQPSSYLLDKTNAYLNIQNSSNEYIFVTDSVPFLQTLLRGYVPYFSENINNSGNRQAEILRCIEYGTYPSYLIADKSSYYLKNEVFHDIFGIEYHLYHDLITDEYQFVNDALKEVMGAGITAHQVISEGLIAVSYDNGKTILVNYNDHDVTYLGLDVKAKNYLLVGDINA